MKLSIAAALSHHARLLILDEATSGLDPIVRDEILDLFFEFSQDDDHSILIASHIVSDLEKLCDYIAFLHRGRLLLCDEKDRLLESHGILRCAKSALGEIDRAAIRGIRESPYGIEALVDRTQLSPGGPPLERASLEDIIIFTAKGAQAQ